jgi:hypothetical protein
MVAILMAATTAFNYWRKISEDELDKIYLSAIGKAVINTENGETSIEYLPYTAVAILALLACGIAIYEITQFKNRLLQLKLGALNSLFMGATLVLMIWFVNQNEGIVNNAANGAFLVAFYFPAAAMLCNILANRFIRKDEKLVRSADRMR